jgi:hypothetical protein
VVVGCSQIRIQRMLILNASTSKGETLKEPGTGSEGWKLLREGIVGEESGED